MSAIIDFYRGGPDPRGRLLHDMLRAGDAFWEEGHDFIQWLFPLPEPSSERPESPVATQDDFNLLGTDSVLKMRVLAALGRYIAFLDRTSEWRRPKDINHRRITRVIRCLCFCGLNDEAFEFCEYAKAVVGKIVDRETIWFWEEALKRHPAWLPPWRG